MRVCFWGTRGSYPASFSVKELSARPQVPSLAGSSPLWENSLSLPTTYGIHTSCVEIQPGELENAHILCDAGTGIVEFIERFNQALTAPRPPISPISPATPTSSTASTAPRASTASRPPQTFHIFLSHLHWDHIWGFPFFAVKVPPKSHIVLHGHHEAIERVFRGMFDTPVFPVAFKDLKVKISFDIKKPGASFKLGSTTVSSLLQKHPGLSYAYKFEAHGKTVVYSTDCEHPKGDYAAPYPFVDFCKQANVVIFDAMSSLAEAQQRGWGHSTYQVGIELALWAKAEHLIFFHHDPSLKDGTLHTFFSLAQAYKDEYLRSGVLPFAPAPLQLSMAYDALRICV